MRVERLEVVEAVEVMEVAWRCVVEVVKIESGDVGISMTCACNRFSPMLFLLIDSTLTAQLLAA